MPPSLFLSEVKILAVNSREHKQTIFFKLFVGEQVHLDNCTQGVRYY